MSPRPSHVSEVLFRVSVLDGEPVLQLTRIETPEGAESRVFAYGVTENTPQTFHRALMLAVADTFDTVGELICPEEHEPEETEAEPRKGNLIIRLDSAPGQEWRLEDFDTSTVWRFLHDREDLQALMPQWLWTATGRQSEGTFAELCIIRDAALFWSVIETFIPGWKDEPEGSETL